MMSKLDRRYGALVEVLLFSIHLHKNYHEALTLLFVDDSYLWLINVPRKLWMVKCPY